MRFFYKNVPEDIDEYIKLWCEIELMIEYKLIDLKFE